MAQPDGIALGPFGGPGGWAVAARSLGIPEVGIEHDAAACATRAAAGHATIRYDVAGFPADWYAGRTWGLVASPPCTQFSAAGKRGGIAVTHILAEGIRDAMNGRRTRAQRRREMAAELRRAAWMPWKMTRAVRAAAIWQAVRNASLVLEPARFISECGPEWVALEQVPAVLPLWEVYAAELRRMGYSAWCGTMNAADYGVPQTRIRAILIASRVREVRRPEPTHYDPRKGDQLWGTPWVSMAEALGWGANERPSVAVTAGGTSTGGAEPFGHRGREALEAEQAAGRWALRSGNQPHAAQRPAPAPAPAPAIAFGHNAARVQWVLRTGRAWGQRAAGEQTADPQTAPAPALTAKSGAQWVVKTFRNNNACERSIDEPAGTLFFGQQSNWAAWVGEQTQESVRITVEEAACLQSFPAGYPWQGSKTARFRQCGDAVPPLLGIAVIGVATGADWQPVAERYAESCRLAAAGETPAEGGEAA